MNDQFQAFGEEKTRSEMFEMVIRYTDFQSYVKNYQAAAAANKIDEIRAIRIERSLLLTTLAIEGKKASFDIRVNHAAEKVDIGFQRIAVLYSINKISGANVKVSVVQQVDNRCLCPNNCD